MSNATTYNIHPLPIKCILVPTGYRYRSGKELTEEYQKVRMNGSQKDYVNPHSRINIILVSFMIINNSYLEKGPNMKIGKLNMFVELRSVSVKLSARCWSVE